MDSSDDVLIAARKAKFDQLRQELKPALVDFVERLGISPADAVLKDAEAYVPYLAAATRDLTSDDDEDRIWFLTRIGYFIGEYLCQALQGCWYVEDQAGSMYFARYVVGRFASATKLGAVDPFDLARGYVDAAPPRNLVRLLAELTAPV
ncbi:hypothetical protein [Stenotrophomonas sp. PS02289]|uniref:hypothetical protein n=1 Tax=Stenotrophomonas sp. PS02289 TaxID=2991422 RepID=UPI00249C346F|nr:hypothetical protein [Stenotrophomonas sp. PS02289]